MNSDAVTTDNRTPEAHLEVVLLGMASSGKRFEFLLHATEFFSRWSYDLRAADDISIMSFLSGGVPTGYRNTGERALTAIDIRWLHSAANDGRPISRMSCYASVVSASA